MNPVEEDDQYEIAVKMPHDLSLRDCPFATDHTLQ